ncbi:MAG: FHA domain-containing protein [Candidatus Aenigmarchaeota archaeon]|nr:FHA domain-containing protein [Candidatus Aenigmarchaeota archaeon]
MVEYEITVKGFELRDYKKWKESVENTKLIDVEDVGKWKELNKAIIKPGEMKTIGRKADKPVDIGIPEMMFTYKMVSRNHGVFYNNKKDGNIYYKDTSKNGTSLWRLDWAIFRGHELQRLSKDQWYDLRNHSILVPGAETDNYLREIAKSPVVEVRKVA